MGKNNIFASAFCRNNIVRSIIPGNFTATLPPCDLIWIIQVKNHLKRLERAWYRANPAAYYDPAYTESSRRIHITQWLAEATVEQETKFGEKVRKCFQEAGLSLPVDASQDFCLKIEEWTCNQLPIDRFALYPLAPHRPGVFPPSPADLLSPFSRAEEAVEEDDSEATKKWCQSKSRLGLSTEKSPSWTQVKSQRISLHEVIPCILISQEGSKPRKRFQARTSFPRDWEGRRECYRQEKLIETAQCKRNLEVRSTLFGEVQRTMGILHVQLLLLQKLAREQNKARGLPGAGYESSTVGETNPQLADMSDSQDLLLRNVRSAAAMLWV